MSSMINPYDQIPRYHQLARILREKIQSGEWQPQIRDSLRAAAGAAVPHQPADHPPGDRAADPRGLPLPRARQGHLCDAAEVAKGFAGADQFFGRSDKTRHQTRADGAESAQGGAARNIARKLDMPADGKTLRIERIRLGDGIPIGLQTSYLALDSDQEISMEEMEQAGSLYKILQEKFGIIPWAADETLEVTLASPEEARLLQIEEGCPLLLNERVLWSQERKAVEYVKILYRGDGTGIRCG